jgi:aspartyl-tRNA(Asn)/glutamyl-tRNA(Gln) amidotransferase subunit A
MDNNGMTAIDIRDAVAQGKVSCREVVSRTFERIRNVEPKVRAFVTLCEDAALRQADEIDAKVAARKPLGNLCGVPVAVKDNQCTKGLRTTCSSKILESFIPPYDATVVERIRQQDGIIVGKTNMDEFAMGSSCEHSAFQATRNPWDLERIPGGSSGGSAAAVAAGMAQLATGSDTGGSIRQPAALCGIVGLKPTCGRVSRYGLVAYASSLDQVGPMASNVRDAALMLNAIAGPDPLDSTSAPVACPDFLEGIEDGVKGLRVGLPKEYFGKGIDPEIESSVRGAVGVLEKLGAKVVEVSLPHTEYGIAAYYIVAPAEASSNLGRYDGVHYGRRAESFEGLVDMYSASRQEGFGTEVKRRILLGTFALSAGYYDAYYLKALKVRRLIKNDFDGAFEKADVLACPTSPVAAFRLGDKLEDPLQMYLCDVLTVCCNLAGMPGMSVPCGFTKSNLPIGMQLLGKPFDEATLLRSARALEREAGPGRRMPV